MKRIQPTCVFTVVVLLMSTFANPGMAQAIFRSVDSDGRVSYSSEAPVSSIEVEEVVFEPGPTDEQIQEARQRMQQQIENAERLSQQRMAEEAARREEIERRRYENPPYPQRQVDDNYYYGYPYRPGFRPWYPHFPVAPKPPPKPAPVTSATPHLLPRSGR